LEQQSFGHAYAKYYDLMYSDKNYEAECDFLDELFRRFSVFPVHRILDISCGTGGHALPLARRGYSLTALDFSEKMIQILRDKLTHMRLRIDCSVGDMRSFHLAGEYDACISMFDSIDYLPDYADVEKTFANVARHLRPRSLFVFQFWNGASVLTIGPSSRCKIAIGDNLRVIRYANPILRASEQLCEVNYHVIAIEGRTVVDEFEEKHLVRFFFPEEIRYLLSRTGWDTIGIYPFMSIERQPTENDWSVLAIARLRSSDQVLGLSRPAS